MCEVGLIGSFMWDPSAAVSRQLRASPSANGQRRPPAIARVAPAHCASRNVGYRLVLVDIGLPSIVLGVLAVAVRAAGRTRGAG